MRPYYFIFINHLICEAPLSLKACWWARSSLSFIITLRRLLFSEAVEAGNSVRSLYSPRIFQSRVGHPMPQSYPAIPYTNHFEDKSRDIIELSALVWSMNPIEISCLFIFHTVTGSFSTKLIIILTNSCDLSIWLTSEQSSVEQRDNSSSPAWVAYQSNTIISFFVIDDLINFSGGKFPSFK